MTDLTVLAFILVWGLVFLGFVRFCEAGRPMTGFELLTGLVTLAVFVYLLVHARPGRGLLMSTQRHRSRRSPCSLPSSSSRPFLGRYMYDVFEGPAHGSCRRSCGRSSVWSIASPASTRSAEQGWKGYAIGVIAFSIVAIVVLYVLQRLQGALPLEPGRDGPGRGVPGFNTAVSFVANTNWQNYAGESTMTYLTQAAGLAVQNFASAAVGMAVAIALTRGLVRRTAGDDRQLLGRPDPGDRSTSCCRSPSSPRSCSSGRASTQTWARPSRP